MAAIGRVKVLKQDLEKDPSLDDIPEQRLKFLEEYVQCGDPKKAWVQAGYAESSTNMALTTIRANWRIVEKLIRTRIGSHVPFALSGIIELAQNAKQESVRLKALQDILFRAGYDAAMKIEHSEKSAQEMNHSEIENELQRLLKRSNDEHALRAKEDIKELH
jgi:phage terminase small subunit